MDAENPHECWGHSCDMCRNRGPVRPSVRPSDLAHPRNALRRLAPRVGARRRWAAPTRWAAAAISTTRVRRSLPSFHRIASGDRPWATLRRAPVRSNFVHPRSRTPTSRSSARASGQDRAANSQRTCPQARTPLCASGTPADVGRLQSRATRRHRPVKQRVTAAEVRAAAVTPGAGQPASTPRGDRVLAGPRGTRRAGPGRRGVEDDPRGTARLRRKGPGRGGMRSIGSDLMPPLALWQDYTRRDVHDIFSPDTTFQPSRGPWASLDSFRFRIEMIERTSSDGGRG
jgi:hypothetical protein